MPDFTILPRANYRRLPWKNGQGETREIAIDPPGRIFADGDFDFRISEADVTRDSDFSTFPDHDRVLIVQSGAGLRLRANRPGFPLTLGPRDPFTFPGAIAIHAELVGGPVRDLTVFFRTAAVKVDVAVRAPGFVWRPRAPSAFAVAIGGEVDFESDGRRERLGDGDTLAVHTAVPVRFPAERTAEVNSSGGAIALIEIKSRLRS